MAAAAAQKLSCERWASDAGAQECWTALNTGCRAAYGLAAALVRPSLRSYPQEQLALTYYAEVCCTDLMTIQRYRPAGF